MDARERMMQIENDQVTKMRARGRTDEQIIVNEPHLADAVRRMFAEISTEDVEPEFHMLPEAAIEIVAHAAAHGTSVSGIEGTRRFEVTVPGTTLAKEMACFDVARTNKVKR